MNIGEKVAYLKGLAEGLDISSDSKNGKIIKGILDVLEDMAASIEMLEDENESLEDYITELDEDLGELEEDFDDTCGHKLIANLQNKRHHDEEDDEEEIEDYIYVDDDDEEESESADNEILDGVFEMRCPHCKNRILIETDEILESDSMSVECPECGGEIEIIEENGGCSCGRCSAHSGMETEEDEEESLRF